MFHEKEVNGFCKNPKYLEHYFWSKCNFALFSRLMQAKKNQMYFEKFWNYLRYLNVFTSSFMK